MAALGLSELDESGLTDQEKEQLRLVMERAKVSRI